MTNNEDYVEIVRNACYGGFSLSAEAVLLARKLSGDDNWGLITTLEEDGSSKSVFGNMHFPKNIKRSDRVLVEVVKTLGEKASGTCAKLVIDSIDKGTAYRIADIDGDETIEFLDNYEWEIAL